MEINIKPDGTKTAIMFTAPDKRKLSTNTNKNLQEKLKITAEKLHIPIVKEYKYLGTYLG
jgi:hypothetical protein